MTIIDIANGGGTKTMLCYAGIKIGIGTRTRTDTSLGAAAGAGAEIGTGSSTGVSAVIGTAGIGSRTAGSLQGERMD